MISENKKVLFPCLPNLESINKLRSKRFDLLLTAAGFEDRVWGITKSLESIRIQHSLIINYQPENSNNKFEELNKLLSGFSKTNVIEFNRYEPYHFSHNLFQILKKLRINSILVDISTMSKLAILLVLDACWKMNLSVSVHYTEATDYAPNKDDFERAKREQKIYPPSIHIYSGVYSVIRTKELSSVSMQGQPNAAIAFMSFNDLLVQALINSIYPSRLFLINGRPPKLKWREKATGWIYERIITEWSETDNPISSANGLPQRTTSTLDYRETVGLLVNMYWKLSINHRLIIAPTGSKMQALGTYIVKALHPDIQIEYPTPKGFLSGYSRNIGKQHFVSFGLLGDFIEALKLFERKSFLNIKNS